MTDFEKHYLKVIGGYTLSAQKEDIMFCISSFLHDIENRLAFSHHQSQNIEGYQELKDKTDKKLRTLRHDYEGLECDLTHMAHRIIKTEVRERKNIQREIADKMQKLSYFAEIRTCILAEIISDYKEYLKDHGPATASVSAAASDDVCHNLEKCISITEELCNYMQSFSRLPKAEKKKEKKLKDNIVEFCNKIWKKIRMQTACVK